MKTQITGIECERMPTTSTLTHRSQRAQGSLTLPKRHRLRPNLPQAWVPAVCLVPGIYRALPLEEELWCWPTAGTSPMGRTLAFLELHTCGRRQGAHLCMMAKPCRKLALVTWQILAGPGHFSQCAQRGCFWKETIRARRQHVWQPGKEPSWTCRGPKRQPRVTAPREQGEKLRPDGPVSQTTLKCLGCFLI